MDEPLKEEPKNTNWRISLTKGLLRVVDEIFAQRRQPTYDQIIIHYTYTDRERWSVSMSSEAHGSVGTDGLPSFEAVLRFMAENIYQVKP